MCLHLQGAKLGKIIHNTANLVQNYFFLGKLLQRNELQPKCKLVHRPRICPKSVSISHLSPIRNHSQPCAYSLYGKSQLSAATDQTESCYPGTNKNSIKFFSYICHKLYKLCNYVLTNHSHFYNYLFDNRFSSCNCLHANRQHCNRGCIGE